MVACPLCVVCIHTLYSERHTVQSKLNNLIKLLLMCYCTPFPKTNRPYKVLSEDTMTETAWVSYIIRDAASKTGQCQSMLEATCRDLSHAWPPQTGVCHTCILRFAVSRPWYITLWQVPCVGHSSTIWSSQWSVSQTRHLNAWMLEMRTTSMACERLHQYSPNVC